MKLNNPQLTDELIDIQQTGCEPIQDFIEAIAIMIDDYKDGVGCDSEEKLKSAIRHLEIASSLISDVDRNEF